VPCTVVVNDLGQYSIWPMEQATPEGWRSAGFSGPRGDCLAHIEEIWPEPTATQASSQVVMNILSDEERDAATMIRDLLYGRLVSHALSTLTELGIPDLLEYGPKSAAELAQQTNTDVFGIVRLLRNLAVFGVLDEVTTQTFALSPLGRALTSRHPASAGPSALLVGGAFGAAWTDLFQTLVSGRPAFERRYGVSLFEYLEQNPELGRIFDLSQASGLALELDEILRHVDFSGYSTVIDIGGGDGAFIGSVLRAYPELRGILFDLATSVARAESRLRELAVHDRCALAAGDFFEEVPQGGDLYLLSHVLHDWDDESAVRILRSCHRAMDGTAATLMVVDLIAADRGEQAPRMRAAALMDLYMLSLFGGGGGQERSADQLTALLYEAGFGITGIEILPSGMGVVRAVPASHPVDRLEAARPPRTRA
jgi:uncharacterized protein YbdZ (MbtH family)